MSFFKDLFNLHQGEEKKEKVIEEDDENKNKEERNVI